MFPGQNGLRPGSMLATPGWKPTKSLHPNDLQTCPHRLAPGPPKNRGEGKGLWSAALWAKSDRRRPPFAPTAHPPSSSLVTPCAKPPEARLVRKSLREMNSSQDTLCLVSPQSRCPVTRRWGLAEGAARPVSQQDQQPGRQLAPFPRSPTEHRFMYPRSRKAQP